jgi:hypothetical protein
MLHDKIRPDGESEHNDPHQRSMLFSGWRRGLRGRQLPTGLLILLFLQGLLTFLPQSLPSNWGSTGLWLESVRRTEAAMIKADPNLDVP